MAQRGQDRAVGVEGRDHVDQCDADLHRSAITLAGDRHQAREALHDGVVARPLAIGTGRPETGDRAVDEARVDAPERVPAEREIVHGPRLEVLDHHVPAAREIQEQCLALWVLEVERDAALPAVHGEEVRRLPVRRAGRRPLAAVVSTVRMLDLDHLGPVVAEDLGRERSRDDAREVDDPQLLERAGHASSSRVALPLYPPRNEPSTREPQ
jgi:hypothetical protein